jgi:hypothetical protein
VSDLVGQAEIFSHTLLTLLRMTKVELKMDRVYRREVDSHVLERVKFSG